MGEYSWVVQSDKFWTPRKQFLESVIKAYVLGGVYSWLLVPPSLGPKDLGRRPKTVNGFDLVKRGRAMGGGYQEEEGAREKGGRSNGVSRVATLTIIHLLRTVDPPQGNKGNTGTRREEAGLKKASCSSLSSMVPALDRVRVRWGETMKTAAIMN